MQVVRNFCDDIHMEFWLDKCAKNVLKKVKLVHSQNLILDFNREMQELKQGKTHKYLGTGKWGHTKSRIERQIEEGVQQEIKNDTEVRSECQ